MDFVPLGHFVQHEERIMPVYPDVVRGEDVTWSVPRRRSGLWHSQALRPIRLCEGDSDGPTGDRRSCSFKAWRPVIFWPMLAEAKSANF